MNSHKQDKVFDSLDMQSPDLVSENIAKIQALFPNCVTEAADGLKIDFDLLKQELSNDIVEGRKERYRLEWPGKRESLLMANTPTNKTLRPIREDSVDFDNTENVYIEGDNLEVLKLLQGSYHGKVKMIYIDPPYNTGSDFVYADDFRKGKEEYEEESGQVDEEGNRLFLNKESNGRYHSDWLSMMYPRLKLARNLLSMKGVIFISIDDHEVDNLRKLCDEVFGESNFIANVVWQRAFSPKNDAKFLSDSHDHILIIAKDSHQFIAGKLDRTEEANSRYNNEDNDPRGPWVSGDLTVKTYSEKYDYAITTPSGRIVNPSHGSCWRVSKQKFQELLEDNRIWFGKGGSNVPRLKRFLSEVSQGMVATTLWLHTDVGHNQEGRQEVKALFDGKGYFDGPKPIRLLNRVLKIAKLDEDSIVLDFFSGSASSAHATLQLNAMNESNVKYIQVQLPEKTGPKSEAYKAGYHNICEIGKERIRRAAEKIKEETGAEIDYGFRVYRLDDSNMNDVYYLPQDYEQGNVQGLANNIKLDRSAEDLLTQIILDWGLPLSLPIEQAEIGGKKVYKVAGDSLFACFDADINESFAEAVAEYKPHRLVFKDNSFSSNNAKINMKQVLMQLCPETEVKVI